MRPLLLSLIVLVTLVSPASAQSLRHATVTFAGAATADWISTRDCFRGRRCFAELNPLIGWANRGPDASGRSNPDAMIALGAAMDVAGVWAWNRTVGKRHKRIAVVGLYAMSAFRVWLTVRNTRRELPPQYRAR